MIRKLLLFVLLSTLSLFAATPRTMRLDYYHTGNDHSEMFSMGEVVLEPLPWPGNLAKSVDDTNLGKYYFEVRDRDTNKVIYSRGFASIFGEWEETDEAKEISRTFSESLRFPAPEKPVQIVVKKRDAQNAFRELWTVNIDPKDKFIDHAVSKPPAQLIKLQDSGDPTTHVDFL
ncbi:MAG TPA: peptidase M64 N-terminal domain-containing protein, partial [Terriglobales bacterium]|nr:peptidase M64 N-terminal domain-containing protein [Terriglobales bacterium]